MSESTGGVPVTRRHVLRLGAAAVPAVVLLRGAVFGAGGSAAEGPAAVAGRPRPGPAGYFC
jgi:hypothetical protein